MIVFEKIIIEEHFSRPPQRYMICHNYQKKFSLTYTMFEVLDGDRFSQPFRNCYH